MTISFEQFQALLHEGAINNKPRHYSSFRNKGPQPKGKKIELPRKVKTPEERAKHNAALDAIRDGIKDNAKANEAPKYKGSLGKRPYRVMQ